MTRPLPVSLRFEPRGHRYTLGRLRLPSVTAILGMDPRSPDWERITLTHGTAKRDRGTRVHAIIKARLTGLGRAGTRSREKLVLGRFDDWLRTYDVRIGTVEKARHHPTLLYGGTPDIEGMIRKSAKPGPFVGDFKTCAPSPLHGLQLAGYDLMLPPVPRPLVRRRLGLYLTPKGVTVHEYDDPSDYSRFLDLLAAYWRMHNAEDI